MEYFTRKACQALNTERGRKQWEQLHRDYQAHFVSIQPELSPAWQQLALEDFHDRVVVSVDRPTRDEVVIELDEATLVFRGVSAASLPAAAVNDLWLHHEVHLGEESGATLLVLLATDELRISAEEVEIIGREAQRLCA